MRIIDISNDVLSAEVYEGDPVPELISLASLKNGDRYNLNAVNMGLHNGTHMDAPLHFIDGADGIDKVKPDAFIGPCTVLEVSPGIFSAQGGAYTSEIGRQGVYTSQCRRRHGIFRV